jgi:hypothetical protein
MRERVLGAVTRLGHMVDQRARSLADRRSQVIGLLVHGVGTGYTGEIVRGSDAELTTVQHDLLLYNHSPAKDKGIGSRGRAPPGVGEGLLLVLPRNPRAPPHRHLCLQ